MAKQKVCKTLAEGKLFDLLDKLEDKYLLTANPEKLADINRIEVELGNADDYVVETTGQPTGIFVLWMRHRRCHDCCFC